MIGGHCVAGRAVCFGGVQASHVVAVAANEQLGDVYVLGDEYVQAFVQVSTQHTRETQIS